MELEEILSRCRPDHLLAGILGISPDFLTDDKENLLSFSHGVEASLSMLGEMAESGLIDPDRLGVPFPVEISGDDTRDLVRRHLLRAIYESFARLSAQRADASQDVLIEPVETAERLVLIGPLSFYARFLEELGLEGAANFIEARMPLDLVPRKASSPFGFEASLVGWERLTQKVDDLIFAAVLSMLEGDGDDRETIANLLVFDGRTDLRGLLGFASSSDRARLEAVTDILSGDDLLDDGLSPEFRRRLRYRTLQQSLLDHIEDQLRGFGFGMVEDDLLGHPSQWHYSAKAWRSAQTALAFLLGDRSYAVPARAAGLVDYLRVAAPWDAALPNVLMIREELLAHYRTNLFRDSDLVVCTSVLPPQASGFLNSVQHSLFIESAADLNDLRDHLNSGWTLFQYLESFDA